MIFDSAIISIIILVFCIVLFITRIIPNAATACLGCLLFVIFDICTLSEAFSGFSNSTVLLMFCMMILGIAMMDTGCAQLIGDKVAKWSAHNERLFILMAGLASALLSTFLSNTAVIAIFLPIISSITRSDKKMNRMNLTLPVTMGAMFGGVCTLVGSTPQLTANGILSEMCDMELKMFDYTLPGVIICAIYLFYVETIGYRFGKRIWGERILEENNVDTNSDIKKISINKTKLTIMILIFSFTIISFVSGVISTAMTAICAALLCIITKCTSQKSIIKNMDWSVVFVLAGCLGIATGISKGGAGELMGNVISKVLHAGIAPIVIFAIFVLCTMLVSNFITNSTAVVIMLPIALSLCVVNSMNPITFTLGIVFAANLTFSTPLANAQTAMTLVAGYRFSDYIRYTWLLDILVLIAIIVVIPFFYPLIL